MVPEFAADLAITFALKSNEKNPLLSPSSTFYEKPREAVKVDDVA